MPLSFQITPRFLPPCSSLPPLHASSISSASSANAIHLHKTCVPARFLFLSALFAFICPFPALFPSVAAKGRIVTCQFNSGKSRKLILFADQDAQLLVDLIAGYISFRKSKRKETFAQKVFSRHSARSPPFPLARSALSPKIKIKGHSPFVNSRNESGGSTSSGGTSSGMFGAGKISSISQFPDGASYDSRLPEGKQDHAFLLNADRGDTSTFSPDDR